MITRIFLGLTHGSGARRRWLFRTFFEFIAYLSGDQEQWTFMNYGFAGGADGDRLCELTPVEEAQRVCCRLYDEVARAQPIAGRDVVEVSCGRGGGSAYVARHMKPRTMTGIDIANGAIGFCRKVHRSGNLRFLQGDAEFLPLFDESCDVAINVEASFCYGDFEHFLSEIHRVLRPGGHFLFADLRFEEELAEWFAALEGSGLDLVEREEISENVLDALYLDGDRRERELRRNAPWILRGPLRTFSGTRGSRIPVMLASGALRYYRFVLVKPGPGAGATRAGAVLDGRPSAKLAAVQ
jgi:SAM-dependent methyltransferase